MPNILGEIEFLARLDKYQEEKPYTILVGEDEVLEEDVPVSNLEFKLQSEIEIRDIREHPNLKFNECGFEYIVHHKSRIAQFSHHEDIAMYRQETCELLKRHFCALEVITYEVKLRQNAIFDRKTFDINDSLVPEGPAQGAHVDVTVKSAPEVIRKHLTYEQQQAYLRPGHRLRIINTWRPMNRVLEDRPLAVCDSRTVMKADLATADRVLPDRIGEIYFLHHGSQQQWYWLEKQKCTEPLILLMYDTATAGQLPRLCPHVSFHNSRASSNAEIRSSVETRSIVITKSH